MPPHCDSLDGPVVSAARQALEFADVDLVLPFVPEDGEEEIRRVFATVLPVRALNEAAREVADRTWRRIHPDVWEILTDAESDLDPASIPSLLNAEDDDAMYERQDLDDLGGDAHNVAYTDATLDA